MVSKVKRRDLIFGIGCLLIMAIQIYKARLSFGTSDEHFYITLGYRVLTGDRPLVDEWHIAQLISFFIYPLVKTYTVFAGDSEGIVLFFRIMYALFTLFVGICIYLRFRKKYKWALVAALGYMSFTPFSIMALSYNTMGPGFLILSFLCLPDDYDARRILWAGALFACAVLNSPYLAILYVISFVLVLFKKINLRYWLTFTLGIGMVFVLFMIYLLTRSPLKEIIANLPGILNDPSHSDGLFMSVYKNVGRLYLSYGYMLIVMAVCVILSFIFRKNDKVKGMVLVISVLGNLACIMYLCFVNTYQREMGSYSLLLVPVAVECFIVSVMYEKDMYLKAGMYLSLFYSLVLAASSNVGPRSFVGPLIICLVMLALMLDSAGKLDVLLKGFVAIVIGLLLFYKVTFVYMGSGNYENAARIGPLKGLYDSRERCLEYEASMYDMMLMDSFQYRDYYVNLITNRSWEYLALDNRTGTFSTYLYVWDKDDYLAKQNEYDALHNKRPCLVYVDNKNQYGLKSIDGGEIVKELNNGTLYIVK